MKFYVVVVSKIVLDLRLARGSLALALGCDSHGPAWWCLAREEAKSSRGCEHGCSQLAQLCFQTCSSHKLLHIDA